MIKTNKKGYMLSVVVIFFMLTSLLLASSLPFIKKNLKYQQTNNFIEACLVDQAGNYSTQECQTLVKRCLSNNYDNTCNKLQALAYAGNNLGLNPVIALNYIKNLCDEGNAQSCDFLVDRCLSDDSLCDIPTYQHDVAYYLYRDYHNPLSGAVYVREKIESAYRSGLNPALNAKLAAMCSNNAKMACGILAKDCLKNSNKTSCQHIVNAVNNGATVAYEYGYGGNITRNCRTIKDKTGTTTSQAYRLTPERNTLDTGTVNFKAYCDMQTEGGGWTLVLKVTGNSSILNRTDYTRWINRSYLGDISNLSSQNALGKSYETVPFTDIMIRSLETPSKNLGWRFPEEISSLYTPIKLGQRRSDAVRIFGSIQNLDYRDSASYHNDCPDLMYGFFGHDYTYSSSANALYGHIPRSLNYGHTGAIIAASVFDDRHHAYDRNHYCISDFGVGARYKSFNSDRHLYNIQGHWWGAGNVHTADFNAHGVFVR